MAQLKYAITLWVGDSIKMSVHHLKFVTIPKNAGWSRNPGTSEEWEFKVLAVGGKIPCMFKDFLVQSCPVISPVR